MFMNERIAFDRASIGHCSHLIGIDEAGRGPLAGPVVVCGVKLDRHFLQQMENFPILAAVNDSKKLSPEKREILFKYLLNLRKQGLLRCTTVTCDEKIIDKMNILEATTLAMNGVICRLNGWARIASNVKILIDGKPVKNLQFDHWAIIKGDRISFCIASASIVAKVIRDRMMDFFAKKYPFYGFERHRGYGTAAHMDAIGRHGLSPIHRLTFCRHLL
jgi:ribonuclease HII